MFTVFMKKDGLLNSEFLFFFLIGDNCYAAKKGH